MSPLSTFLSLIYIRGSQPFKAWVMFHPFYQILGSHVISDEILLKLHDSLLKVLLTYYCINRFTQYSESTFLLCVLYDSHCKQGLFP
jgi:hypothetical protein